MFHIDLRYGKAALKGTHMSDKNQKQTTVRTVEFEDELWEKIRTFQHENKIKSRIEALRIMVSRAYFDWEQKSWKP